MKSIGDAITVANFKGRDEVKSIILDEYEKGGYFDKDEIISKIGAKIIANIKETEDIGEQELGRNKK